VAVAADATDVYWSELGPTGSIMRLSKSGGFAVPIAAATTAQAMAVDDTDV
jgi:hypothetical protein